MPLSGKELVRLMQRYGWVVSRIKGSHFIMSKGKKVIPVPVHGNKSLGKSLESRILKLSGVRKK